LILKIINSKNPKKEIYSRFISWENSSLLKTSFASKIFWKFNHEKLLIGFFNMLIYLF
jgi:hypothetical protein